MKILRQKSFSDSKKEKDKKKAKIAAGASILGGAGSAIALERSAHYKAKANVHGLVRDLQETINPKLDETINKNSQELSNRYNRRVDKAILKSEKAALKLGKTSAALGAISLGTGAYAMKKFKDSKKDDNSKK